MQLFEIHPSSSLKRSGRKRTFDTQDADNVPMKIFVNS